LLELVEAIDVSNSAGVIPQLMSALRRRGGDDAVDHDHLTILLLRPNGAGAQVPLRDRALALARLMKNFLGSISGREPAAWPEGSLANLGGALFGPLNRLRHRGRAAHVLGAQQHGMLPECISGHVAAARRGVAPPTPHRSALVEVVVAAVESRVAAESANAAPVEVNSAA
jgi:hypothetical protein